MEKVLDQQQIDAMVRAARGGAAGAGGKVGTTVTPWNVRESGRIGRDQVQAITTLHQDFARNLTNSLGAYLRVEFTAALVSAEHMAYGEFLGRIGEAAYLASCALSPFGATALLQIDLSVAFPLVDVMLGGEGTAVSAPERAITGIEEEILETVIRIICREFEKAWKALSVGFAFEKRVLTEQVARLLPQQEKTLALSFEIAVADSHGTLNLVVPAAVSNALLRKIASSYEREAVRATPEAAAHLRQLLLRCPFEVDMGIQLKGVPVRDLTQISPGGVLITREKVSQPAALRVSGIELFSARVTRRDSWRAAQVLERIPPPETQKI